MTTVDTEIRHVTRAGANLFLELGFPAAEARKLHAASRKQINDTRALKQQLMTELANWIAEHQLKQADAAQILMVSPPARFGCGEPEDREVHDRHAGRDAQPRGQAGAPGRGVNRERRSTRLPRIDINMSKWT